MSDLEVIEEPAPVETEPAVKLADLSVAVLREQAPALVAAIESEAAADAVATVAPALEAAAREQGYGEGVTAGAARERSRISVLVAFSRKHPWPAAVVSAALIRRGPVARALAGLGRRA